MTTATEDVPLEPAPQTEPAPETTTSAPTEVTPTPTEPTVVPAKELSEEEIAARRLKLAT